MNHFKSHTMRQVLSEWFNTLCFPVSLEYHHTQRCVVTIYHLYIVDLSVEKDVYSVYWERETHSTAQVEGLSEWHSEVRGQWLAEVLEAGSRCGMSFVSERVLAHWRGGREGARLVTLKKKPPENKSGSRSLSVAGWPCATSSWWYNLAASTVNSRVLK